MTNWSKMQECSNYNLPSIKSLKRLKAKKAKKAAKKQTEQVIKGYQKDLTERKTGAETTFESFLNKLQIKFEFQKIIRSQKQHYIVDFFLPEYHTIIEIDGDYHNEPSQRQKDKARTRTLKRSNIVARIIRLTNQEALSPDLYKLFLQRLCPFMGYQLLADLTTDRYLIPEMDKSINTEAQAGSGQLRIVK